MPRSSSVKNAIPFARPALGPEEEAAVIKILRTGWLTTGSETAAFEHEFAAFLSVDNAGTSGITALAVNSATSGLHLALEAVGTGPGDVILTPSLTFTATAGVARYLGAEIAFVDVEPGSFLIDPAALETTLSRLASGLPAYGDCGPTGRPRAIIPVHYGGMVCNMEEIMRIARKYNVRVIEDAAHSFPSFIPRDDRTTGPPSRRRGAFAGTLGDIGVFSFYATKTMTTGEGGMAVTRNRKLAARMSLMRSHGIDRPVFSRYTDIKAGWFYRVVAPGFKYNLPDVLAAIGRVQLCRATAFLEERRAIAVRYNAAFGDDPRFRLPPALHVTGTGAASNAWHLYPLRVRPRTLGLSRNEAALQLQNAGIGVSVHFLPLHTMPYYKRRYKLRASLLPHTIAASSAEISLPIWPGMTDDMVNRVIAACRRLGKG